VKPKRKYTKRKTVTKTVVDEKTGEEVEVSVPAMKKRMNGFHSTKRQPLALEDIAPAERTLRDIIRSSLVTDRKKELARQTSVKQAEQEANKHLAGESKAKEDDEAGAGGVGAIDYAPQVEVVNGRIVVNQNTLVVKARNSEVSGYRRVVEEQPLLNSHSYSNWRKPVRWTDADTELFYVALTQFGLDFNLISQLFPKRTRTQVKQKFKRESKRNQAKIEQCISGKGRDQDQYHRMMAQLKLQLGISDSSLGSPSVGDGTPAASASAAPASAAAAAPTAKPPSPQPTNAAAADAPSAPPTAAQSAAATFGEDFFDEEEDAYIY